MKILNKREIKKIVQKNSRRDQDIVLIMENIQYARNVASLFRTADAAGVKKIILTGISQKPPFGKDLKKASRSSEDSVAWEYIESTGKAIQSLKKEGFVIIAVELTDSSVELSRLNELVRSKNKICFILGSEVYGIKNTTLDKVDKSIYIPMYGKNASLNVTAAGAIVLFSF